MVGRRRGRRDVGWGVCACACARLKGERAVSHHAANGHAFRPRCRRVFAIVAACVFMVFLFFWSWPPPPPIRFFFLLFLGSPQDAIFHVDQRGVAGFVLANLHLAVCPPRLHLAVQALVPTIRTLICFSLWWAGGPGVCVVRGGCCFFNMRRRSCRRTRRKKKVKEPG